VRPENVVGNGQHGARDVVQVFALLGRDDKECQRDGMRRVRSSGQRTRNSSRLARIVRTKSAASPVARGKPGKGSASGFDRSKSRDILTLSKDSRFLECAEHNHYALCHP
jgi:hypothetical protein